ncbi:hypothetical protein JXA88_00910, partial [Candidatus Fermentibacteria bacterium]|nr:hypothetical protein [Candidatus Fermentibacteria bacterium]
SAWYHKATGIASNQGSPPDYQWINGFRTKLLNYTYTEMDQIYDPSATAAMVTAALNEGRSLVVYMGHGSSTSWGTTGFSNTNVNALSNYWMLPVIHSVACDNGNFSTTTCFGEAWLRAQSGGQPRGALAAYMSSISQGWTPPQYGQQGFVDSLVSDRYNTVGGTLFIGGMAMLEHYNGGYDGTSHFNTWIIFGDCSVQMRTDSPAAMAATYPTAVLVGTSSIPVTVAGVEGALVGVSAEGEWLGSGYTDGAGTVNVTLNEPLNVPGTVKLTITGYNKEPIQADIEVIPPTGPYVIYQSTTVLGDGQADIGETVSLNIELKNVGIETAYGVVGTLSTTNGQIAVTAPSQGYGDMAPGATALPGEPYVFEVGSLADNTVVPFHLDIVSGLDSWEADFPLTVHAPDLAEAGWQIDDTEGNGNGRLDPGETVGLTVTVVNGGSGTALGTQLAISESDPYLTIIGPTTQALGDIPSGAQTISPTFTLTADGDCPIPYGAQLSLQISSNAGFHSVSGVVNLLIGQADLLVVDSDAEITETRIIDALLELGYAHTRWNTFDPGKAVVPLDTLLAHHTVIWTAGDQGSTGITPDNQANLIAYLNQEGSLLLSAENYAPNYPSAPLTTSYLRITSSQANISGSAVDGTTGDPVGDGISATLSYPTGLDVMPDAITPGIGAVTVFRMQGSNSSVVIRYAGEGPASFKTMFFGVPLEAFPALASNPDNIGTVISRSLSWLAGGDILAPTTPSNPMLANDGTLSWSPATDNVGVDYYSVYRSLSAFFSVQGMTPWATPAGTSVQITEGLGDVAVNYTYRVTATDAAGNESPASPPVGEFDFEIQE